ncbi:MAG: PilZ domain-containing protein [Bdellovibrionales bacterium]|nr:PilZ domain-containing protein [Bdellovibrionales bacterium]
MVEFIEKRRCTRIVHTAVIDITRKNSAYFYDYTQNFCENGVYFKTKAPLDVSEKIILRFTLPGFDFVFEAISKVVWIQRESHDSGVGLEFVEISDPERAQLKLFIERYSHNNV